MEKILIIGSKGFIGEHLKQHLDGEEYEVWGADVIVDYEDTEYYHLIDATNSDYYSIFEKHDYDLCVNCSGAASVPHSLNKSLRDFQLNTANVFKILEAIRKQCPACKFINLSSAAVYGNPESMPVNEMARRNPMSPYGYHKMMSEQICEEYHRFFNISTCSLRIFSAFGDGLKKQIFWDLYQKSKKNERIDLYGSGKESRDFIYIKDLVRAIEVVAKSADFQGEFINVANGEEVFIEDCVQIFYSMFDKEIEYRFSGKAREGDPDNWVADISIIKKLGYNRKFSLKEGLKNYYRWVKETD